MPVPSQSKPEYRINLSSGSPNPLEAYEMLRSFLPNAGHHLTQNLRPALGIYNTSISRVCEKTIKCCEHLERYFKTSDRVAVLRSNTTIHKLIIDYLELTLYAAAEHVDDLRLIAKGFFQNQAESQKSKSFRAFDESIKTHKSLIAASANAIKHAQARIRLYSLEFRHDGTPTCMHGYFIEGVSNGVVGPNQIFHDENKQVFSITSLIWEVITFLLHTSRSLNEFLKTVEAAKECQPPEQADTFKKLVIAAARLPLYSFDDNHPFARTRVIIDGDAASLEPLKSRIYGSITSKWSKSDRGEFGDFFGGYEGDGVTRTFKIVQPAALHVQHWD